MVTQDTKVCSRHFQDHEIVTTATGRRVLAAGSVPSLFEWNKYTNKSRAGVWERRYRPPSPEPDPVEPEEDSEQPAMGPMVVDHDYGASGTVYVDREQYVDMLRELEALREQVQTYHLSNFGLKRFASSNEDIRFYTR